VFHLPNEKTTLFFWNQEPAIAWIEKGIHDSTTIWWKTFREKVIHSIPFSQDVQGVQSVFQIDTVLVFHLVTSERNLTSKIVLWSTVANVFWYGGPILFDSSYNNSITPYSISFGPWSLCLKCPFHIVQDAQCQEIFYFISHFKWTNTCVFATWSYSLGFSHMKLGSTQNNVEFPGPIYNVSMQEDNLFLLMDTQILVLQRTSLISSSITWNWKDNSILLPSTIPFFGSYDLFFLDGPFIYIYIFSKGLWRYSQENHNWTLLSIPTSMWIRQIKTLPSQAYKYLDHVLCTIKRIKET
jgi:hypothetical protein